MLSRWQAAPGPSVANGVRSGPCLRSRRAVPPVPFPPQRCFCQRPTLQLNGPFPPLPLVLPVPSGPSCPACGAIPLSDEELQIVRKPGRRSKRDASGKPPAPLALAPLPAAPLHRFCLVCLHVSCGCLPACLLGNLHWVVLPLAASLAHPGAAATPRAATAPRAAAAAAPTPISSCHPARSYAHLHA